MPTVNEVVLKFRAEAGNYLQAIEAINSKHHDMARRLTEVTGSAEKAMAALNGARGDKSLADLGLDQGQVNGVLAQLKEID